MQENNEKSVIITLIVIIIMLSKKHNKSTQRDICGATISYNNKPRHVKSKKHSDVVYIQYNKFEMK